MKYKTGNNDFDLCSSMDLNELLNPITYKCTNSSKSRSYTMTEVKKKLILTRLKEQNIDIKTLDWIGEKRTKIKNVSTLLQFGYSSFVSKDRG